MTRPRLLDLFCGAGGAAMGYSRAGFDVVGVDIKPQPHYPFEFEQGDALQLMARNLPWLRSFDVVHASPPCQFGTAYMRRPEHVRSSPNLIPEVRAFIHNVPYVIENTWTNRAHLNEPIRLCGSSFGLDVQRHRAFESNVSMLPPPCDHGWQTARFPQATNRANLRRTVEVGVWRIPLVQQRRAMGIDWMDLTDLSEAIPPRLHRMGRATTHCGAFPVSRIVIGHKDDDPDRPPHRLPVVSTDGRGDIFDVIRGAVIDLPTGTILPGWVQKAAVIARIDRLETEYQPPDYDQTCEQCRSGGHVIPPPHRMAGQ